MLVFPNAKINLGLYVTSKRPDGYHNLITCFYPVSWQDALEIVPSDVITFTTSGIAIPGNSDDNLCLKAYHLLAKDYDLPPVHIHLHKNIAMGAGLGGGSSDAAFTIKTLNNLFELHLSTEQQQNYARQLGSDCAFFIENKPVLAVERGDQFLPIQLPDLSNYYILLVYPSVHVSTQLAYSQVKPQMPIYSLEKSLTEQPITTWKDVISNDFEKSVFAVFPLLAEIKQKLYDLGAIYAAMSGSGSTLFGIFEQLPETNYFDNCKIWSGKM